MLKKDDFIFDTLESVKDLHLTKCMISSDPEVVVAIVGEDVPKGYEDPLYLGNKYVVELPQIIVGYSKEVTIWFSKEVSGDTMANLIQEYFSTRFPELKVDENTVMGVSEPGKIKIFQDK